MCTQRTKRASRLICSVATEATPKQVEESQMDAPKEIFLKDYKLPDYYFDTVWIALSAKRCELLGFSA